MLCDYHLHCSYSVDAEGACAEYCAAAARAGLSEIALTPHYDLDPYRTERVVVDGRVQPMSGPWLDRYVAEVLELRAQWAPRGLVVLLGLEVDYCPEVEPAIERVVTLHPWDVVIGAVHNLDHVSLSAGGEARSYFRAHPAEEVVPRFYAVAQRMVERCPVDVVAHLDVFRRHSEAIYGTGALDEMAPLAGPVLRAIADRDLALEINTWARPLASGKTLPSAGVLQQAPSAGVRAVTVGSDAHRPGQVGIGVAEATRLTQDLGLGPPVRFRERRRLV